MSNPTSDFVSVNGIRLHYLDWGGSDPALIFLTGMGCTAYIFSDFAPRFTDRFRVLALTRRGQGDSYYPDTGYDADTLVEDIRQFMDQLHIQTAVLAQGPLTPPGPPAALFKTLEQIEPRTDLRQVPGSASIGHIISRPGSYYLSTNLVFTNQSGIRIIADDVTLDLNGFILQGVTNRTAILGTNGLERVRIRNGILRLG